ncbi:MAG: hybrid sensor histidine kinase/response regulator, partial [Pararhodobacter sp.]|nr:hybrid sensor histidine kinase/response regulator [Pararhodobacter sp.]
MAAATTLALIACATALVLVAARGRRQSLAETLIGAAIADPDAVVLTDGAGRGMSANPVALAARATGAASGTGVPAPADLLTRWSAEPARVGAALLAEVLDKGHAVQDFTRPDGGLRLSVHRAGARQADEAVLIWRFASSVQGAARSTDALGLPLLTLGPDDAPMAANAAFRTEFGAPGLTLTGPDSGEPILVLKPEFETALEPLRNGGNPVSVDMPGAGGTQARLACAIGARDGQRDIVFLPAWYTGAGEHAPPAPRHDFEDIPVALVLIDAHGRIVDTNRPARGLLGLAPGEMRHFWEVVEGLGRPVADWLADAREGRALNRPEVLRATQPPQDTYVQIILRRAPGPDNQHAIVAVINDATELKSLEARFVQSQKMQAIGQLAGGVAHDFNNLLTAISGHCDLLLLNRDHYDPDYNDLVQIHQNANRAAALVRQLLAFSRKQTLKPETLLLESLLEELTHLLTRLVGERITLTLSHDPRIGTIRADRRQLEQVLMNLVVNARDAMPMGGEILIETEALSMNSEVEHGRARLPAGDYAVIRVIDEGLGIPADIIDKIFEPFFTTKRTGEGTGLGLSTAYGIVKQMGGWIFATSTEGTGTEFTLYFAAQLDRAADPSDHPRPAPPPQRGRRGGPGYGGADPVAPQVP